MKCPHCLVEFHVVWNETHIATTTLFHWFANTTICPSCKEVTIVIDKNRIFNSKRESSFTVYPKTVARKPLSSLIDKIFSKDYLEACAVLTDSPKASAALSRRCLQNLLREKGGVKHDDLSKEIQQVIESGKLPSHLSESIDAIRNIGNFGTHPIKSQNSGEIVEVEAGEAEWTLDVLEELFDFYFVQPSIIKQKKDALNKKLSELKKPPMK